MKPGDDAKRAYDIAMVRRLVRTHRIRANVRDLQAWLQHAGRRGLRFEQMREEEARARTARKRQLRRRHRIAQLAASLAAEVAADDERFELSLEIERLAGERGIKLPFRQPRPSRTAHLEAIGQTTDLVEPVLKLLAAAAERTGEAYRKDNRGRPSRIGLIEFARYIADYYEDRLGLPFTVDYHRGTPLTPALEFLRDAASPLFAATEKQLITAARHAVAERRAHKKRGGAS